MAQSYGAVMIWWTIIVVVLMAIIVGIYFLVIYFKDGPGRKYSSLRDLALKNKDNVTDIAFATYNKNIKYNFNLGNNPEDVTSNTGQIYYDIFSKNIIMLMFSNFFNPIPVIPNTTVWTLSYTYSGQAVSYNVNFINFLSTMRIKSGGNDIVINNYQVSA